MAELCQALTGAAHTVAVRVGQAPPEAAPAAQGAPVDALDAFLARGGPNITVE